LYLLESLWQPLSSYTVYAAILDYADIIYQQSGT